MIQGLFGQEKQIKTCRKLQHVKRYMERNVSKIIRRLTAVGKNYNSTRDNIVLIHTVLYLNNYRRKEVITYAQNERQQEPSKNQYH